MDRLDIATSFVFILLGTFIYSPINFLHGINLSNMVSFVLMLLLILTGISILKRKNRIVAILSMAIVSFLLLYEGIRKLITEGKEIWASKIIFIGDAVISAILLFLSFSSFLIILKEKFVKSQKHNPIVFMTFILAGIIMVDLKHSLTSFVIFHSRLEVYKIDAFFIPLMSIIFIFLILSGIFIYNGKHTIFNLFSLLQYDFYFIFSMFYWNYWNEPFRLPHLLIPIILSSIVIVYYLISQRV